MCKKGNKIRVGVVGAASVAAGMLLKLLLQHRKVEITLLVSETEKNKEIGTIHKFLKGVFKFKTSAYDQETIIKKCDLVFLCKQHGKFLARTARLIGKSGKKGEIKIIDLSADFRLKDISAYEKWYKLKHHYPSLLQEAVYGLPELYGEKIRDAFLIANPGCYPTCTLLALAPLFIHKLVNTREAVIVDAYSGVSGAGRTPNSRNSALEVAENIKPYKIDIHPHTPEMEQELTFLSKKKVRVFFTPHVTSFKNGMLATAYLRLDKKITEEEIREIYKDFYQGKPFVRLCNPGEYPEIKDVEGSNFCDLGIKLSPEKKICAVISALDNLIKGAAGQAVQNMNLLFGIEETEGLPYSLAFTNDPLKG